MHLYRYVDYRCWTYLAGLGALLAQGFVAEPVCAQVSLQGRLGEPVELATFRDARSITVDVARLLYIAEAGRNRIVVVDTLGQVVNEFGASGLGPGEFDEPAGVDAGDGLTLWAADTGNGRLQRFSRQYRWLASLPVHADALQSGEFQGDEPVQYEEDEGVRGGLTGGRPVAIAAAPTGEVYVIDDDSRRVIKWDARLQVERAWGGPREEAGRLLEPIDIAAGTQYVFVADRGLSAVVMYDVYGMQVGTVDLGSLEAPRAVVWAEGRLWVLGKRHLGIYEISGPNRRIVPLDLDEEGVDVALTQGGIYVLTSTRLIRFSRRPGGG